MWKRILEEGIKGDIYFEFPMSRITSFRVGGPAEVLIYPRDKEDVRYIFKIAKDNNIKINILGACTNIIIRDEGLRGITVIPLKYFTDYRIIDREGTIYSDSGLRLSQLIKIARENYLGGLEFLYGIPGSIGGAVAMNAGAFGKEIKDVLKEVAIINWEAEEEVVPVCEIKFDYRESSIPKKGLITGCYLKLEHTDICAIDERIEEVKSKRKKLQPSGFPNAGSIFKNPPGDFAGKIIEDVGLKGFSVGAAMISHEHANFIVNRGGCSARDIIELIDIVRRRVFEEKGIWLEPEVKIL